ncbi:cell wall / vacuolar inhibitor of fructosidase 2-like [Malania oleifera]|uniref:cell wall / vacuolar inhibitor of fructosidase 2-like n=1 Tax=Malania oleifera TaxID=397392 RepID=UPI0025AEA2D5|nr:cell wall / vacuolar inhibitor of fructosidase 2-like [Malania oleifera]
MNAPPTSFLMMLVSSITISMTLFISSPAHAAPSELVRSACNSTNNYTFCVGALESDHRTASASRLGPLSIIALDLAMSNATKTQRYMANLASRSKAKPNVREALEACVENYRGVIGSFRSAAGEVKVKEYMMANYDSAVAGDGASLCDKKLAARGVRNPSLLERNLHIHYFSNIGFVITGKLY